MAKLAAIGALVQYESATGPSVFSTIPCAGDFDLPAVGERDEIDITSHDSSNSTEETILGIARLSTISIPITAWDGTNTHHAAMVTRGAANTLTNFKITTKDTKVYTFAGYVKGVSIGNPVTGALGATLTIKAAAAITVT